MENSEAYKDFIKQLNSSGIQRKKVIKNGMQSSVMIMHIQRQIDMSSLAKSITKSKYKDGQIHIRLTNLHQLLIFQNMQKSK